MHKNQLGNAPIVAEKATDLFERIKIAENHADIRQRFVGSSFDGARLFLIFYALMACLHLFNWTGVGFGWLIAYVAIAFVAALFAFVVSSFISNRLIAPERLRLKEEEAEAEKAWKLFSQHANNAKLHGLLQQFEPDFAKASYDEGVAMQLAEHNLPKIPPVYFTWPGRSDYTSEQGDYVWVSLSDENRMPARIPTRLDTKTIAFHGIGDYSYRMSCELFRRLVAIPGSFVGVEGASKSDTLNIFVLALHPSLPEEIRWLAKISVCSQTGSLSLTFAARHMTLTKPSCFLGGRHCAADFGIKQFDSQRIGLESRNREVHGKSDTKTATVLGLLGSLIWLIWIIVLISLFVFSNAWWRDLYWSWWPVFVVIYPIFLGYGVMSPAWDYNLSGLLSPKYGWTSIWGIVNEYPQWILSSGKPELTAWFRSLDAAFTNAIESAVNEVTHRANWSPEAIRPVTGNIQPPDINW